MTKSVRDYINTMDISIRDKITLNDDNEYVVVSKINYLNQIYYYLIDINNNENIIFCYENTINNSLVESTDKNLNKILLSLFLEVTKDYVKGIDLYELNELNKK